MGQTMESVILVRRETAYDEILDMLKTRREYLERGQSKMGLWSPELEATVARLDELKVVRAIINTLNNQEENNDE